MTVSTAGPDAGANAGSKTSVLAVPADLGGKAVLSFEAEGVVYTVDAPLPVDGGER